MANPYVYVGAVAPEALRVTITPEAGGGLDLSTVTGCTLRVSGSAGIAYWATSIVSQSSAELVVSHEFAVGDTEHPGALSVMPHLSVPGGTRRCAPFTLDVLKR